MNDKILQVLREIKPEFDFNENINFIENGMLDSLDVINLVVALDEAFGISIDGMDITPNNFESLQTISALLIKNGANK